MVPSGAVPGMKMVNRAQIHEIAKGRMASHKSRIRNNWTQLRSDQFQVSQNVKSGHERSEAPNLEDPRSELIRAVRLRSQTPLAQDKHVTFESGIC